MIQKKLILSILIFFVCIGAFSREQQLEIHRIYEDINVDGKVDESFWQSINPLSFIMYNPVFGKEPSEKSDVRIAYNDSYIFISAILAQVMFSTRFSFSSYIQYNSAEKNIISNLRLRYNPSEGNDLYLVINEGRNTILDRELPSLPRIGNRTIILKYTYTFSL
jgi:hypothetical protein